MHNQLNQQNPPENIQQIFELSEHCNGKVEDAQQFQNIQIEKIGVSDQGNKKKTIQNNGIKQKQKQQQEAQDFFAGKQSERKKNMVSGGQELFKRTYSFYEDEQQIQQPKIISNFTQKENNVLQGEQPLDSQIQQNKQTFIVFQEQNKYQKSIRSAKQFLKHLYIGYFISLLRFMMIGFAYYFVQFTIPIKQKSNQTPNTSYQNGTNKVFQPWNVMIYFLSGSIDFISVIGYITSMKALKIDIKTLQLKRNQQNIRLQKERALRQENLKKIKSRQKNSQQNFQQQIQIQPPVILDLQQQIILPRTLRIGKQSVYNSFYSTLRQYKYKNRDQSAPFKISKVMHITASFLFFGRMALIQQYQYEKGQIGRQLILWMFLLTAYLSSFQIDLYGMESSSGPFIKIQKFHTSKVKKIYDGFLKWRSNYGILLKVCAILIFTNIIIDIIGHISWANYMLSASFYFKFPLSLMICLVIFLNKQSIQKCNKYIYQLPQISYIVHHQNLTLQGILQKFSREYNKYIYCIYRLLLLLYGLSVLRQSGQNGDGIAQFSINALVLISLFGTQAWKFRTFMVSKINLLDSFLYKQIRNSKHQTPNFFPNVKNNATQQNFDRSYMNKSKPIHKDNIKTNSNNSNLQHNNKNIYIPSQKQTSHQYIPQNSTITQNVNNLSLNQQSQTSCSVCLLQYQQQINVILLCCGHIFHEQCLLDWLKHKKQCPLCRLNLQEYYQDVSF